MYETRACIIFFLKYLRQRTTKKLYSCDCRLVEEVILIILSSI